MTETEEGAVLQNRYQLLARVGQGSTSSVWRARDRNLDREVAVKLLESGGPMIPQARERFLQELDLIRRVQHPSVIPLLDAGEDGGRLFLVMDYIEGGDLITDVGSRGTGREELCLPLAEGVAAIHEAGIVHRDLKPANILVDASGRPHITDLGLAKLGKSSSVKTRTGIILGTPGFLGPEVLRGGKAGPPSDVYALGVTFYFLLTGGYPFASIIPGELLQEQLRGVSGDSLRPLPSFWAGLIAWMTQLDPKDRPTSAEVVRSIAGRKLVGGYVPAPTRAASSDEVEHSGSPGRPKAKPSGRRRSFGLQLALGGAGFLSLLLLGAMLAPESGPAGSPGEVSRGPGPDAVVAEALKGLSGYSYRKELLDHLGAAPRESSRRLLTNAGERWREEGRKRLREQLEGRDWFRHYEVLRERVDEEFWMRRPKDPGGAKEALDLRRKLVRRLTELSRLDRLDEMLDGGGGLVPGLAGMLRPVVRVRTLPEYRDGGHQLPGARALSDVCLGLTFDPDDPLVKATLAGAWKTHGLTGREICSQYMVRSSYLIELPRAARALSRDDWLVLATGLYDSLPRSVVELSVLDMRGRILSVALLHLPKVPRRFARELMIAQAGEYDAMPIEVALHRSLLGDDATQVRFRYGNLMHAATPDLKEWSNVIGLGVFSAPVGSSVDEP